MEAFPVQPPIQIKMEDIHSTRHFHPPIPWLLMNPVPMEVPALMIPGLFPGHPVRIRMF